MTNKVTGCVQNCPIYRAFGRRFYPNDLHGISRYTFYILIRSCSPWETNPWPWSCKRWRSTV